MSNLLIGVFAWWFAEGIGITQWIKTKLELRRLKPLDCPLCLGWWCGLNIGFYQTQDLSYSLQLGLISSMIGLITERIMNRL